MSDTFTASDGSRIEEAHGRYRVFRDSVAWGRTSWQRWTSSTTKTCPRFVSSSCMSATSNSDDGDAQRSRTGLSATPPNANGDHYVLDELTGYCALWGRDTAPDPIHSGESKDIAVEYFAAHPEPRPWHDAEPDQVRSAIVDSTGGVRPLTVMEYQDKSRVFLDAFHEYTYGLTDPCITGAQQIWPVASP